jgi:hypothetical protein
MTSPEQTLTTLGDLRDFIHAELCRRENLVPEQFEMNEIELTRCGRPCGLQFSIQGPRQVRLSAVWAADRNMVYFYDAGGARYRKLQLSHHIRYCEAHAA